MLVCGKTFEALLQDLQVSLLPTHPASHTHTLTTTRTITHTRARTHTHTHSHTYLQEKGAVMKSAKQLSEAIQHLCFFDADPALLQTMVNLILHNNIPSSDKDGRLVLRLAHYFASSLPPQTKLANMQMKGLLAKQVVHKQLNRRLIALRTLSVAASDSDVRTDLQKHIQFVLNSVESQAAAGTLSRNDAVTNACLQYACMAAIRQRPAQLLLGACSVTPSGKHLVLVWPLTVSYGAV